MEFKTDAERIANERQTLEKETETLKIDISIRQRTVADEQVIADAFRQFEPVFEKLTDNEQRNLLGLLIRQIRIKQIDEVSKKFTSNEAALAVRNKLYSVEIDFSSDKLLLNDLRSAQQQFVKNSKWRPVGD